MESSGRLWKWRKVLSSGRRVMCGILVAKRDPAQPDVWRWVRERERANSAYGIPWTGTWTRRLNEVR